MQQSLVLLSEHVQLQLHRVYNDVSIRLASLTATHSFELIIRLINNIILIYSAVVI